MGTGLAKKTSHVVKGLEYWAKAYQANIGREVGNWVQPERP